MGPDQHQELVEGKGEGGLETDTPRYGDTPV